MTSTIEIARKIESTSSAEIARKILACEQERRERLESVSKLLQLHGREATVPGSLRHRFASPADAIIARELALQERVAGTAGVINQRPEQDRIAELARLE